MRVELRNGQRWEGAWSGIRGDSAELRLEKKGRVVLIARNDIVRTSARRGRVRGRVWGTIGGFYAGAGVAGLARGREGLQSPLALLAIGTALLGFAVGKSIDDTRTEIRFVS